MDKLLSVCTDGAPCMVGKNKGFVALLHEHENRPILNFHCALMCEGQLGKVKSCQVSFIYKAPSRRKQLFVHKHIEINKQQSDVAGHLCDQLYCCPSFK